MSQSVIGALRVNLGMDSASFDRGLKKLRGDVGAAWSDLKRLTGISLAVGGGLTAIGVSAASSAREVSRFSKLANTAPEEFQRWAYGAKSVGIEQDKLADILKDMNDRVGDFLSTGGGPMKDFFEQVAPKVGVTAEQFKNLSGPQALQLYVSSLEKANLNQAEMTFYMEALASDSTLLLPLLRNNGKEMENLGDKAAKLGVVLNAQTIAKLNETSIKVGEVTSSLKGMVNQVAVGAAPILLSMAGWMSQITGEGSKLRQALGWITENLERLLTYGAATVGLYGARFVAAFTAAKVSTLSLAGSMAFLRGAIARTGLGLLIVGIGEAAFQMNRLQNSTGSWGKAWEMTWAMAREVASRALEYVNVSLKMLQGGWFEFLSFIYNGMNSAMLKTMEWGDSAKGVFVGVWRFLKSIFSDLPAVVGEVFFQIINTVLSGLNLLIGKVVEKTNQLITEINQALSSLPDWITGGKLEVELIADLKFDQFENTFQGSFQRLGKNASAAFNDGFNSQLQNRDDTFFKKLGDEAGVSAEKMRRAAETLNSYAGRPLQSVEAIKQALKESGEAANATDKELESMAQTLAKINNESQKVGTEGSQNIRDYSENLQQVDRTIDSVGQSSSYAFADIVTGSQTAKEAVAGLLKEIARMLAQRAFMQAFNSAFGGGGGFGAYASGTPYAPGGMAIVGERGPELVNLPRGSKVYDNGRTKNMLSGWAKGEGSQSLEIFGRLNENLKAYAQGTAFAAGGLSLVGEMGPELVQFPGGAGLSQSPAMMSAGGRSEVLIQLSPDLEARILKEAHANSVRVVDSKTPGIVRKSVSSVGELNRETGNYLGKS